MISRFSSFITSIKPDKSDMCFLIGIVSLFYGTYLYSPRLAFIVLGIIFLVLAYIQDLAFVFNAKNTEVLSKGDE